MKDDNLYSAAILKAVVILPFEFNRMPMSFTEPGSILLEMGFMVAWSTRFIVLSTTGKDESRKGP